MPKRRPGQRHAQVRSPEASGGTLACSAGSASTVEVSSCHMQNSAPNVEAVTWMNKAMACIDSNYYRGLRNG